MMTAVVIDDEPYACQALVTLLRRDCADVQILAVCTGAAEGLRALNEMKPDIVFLDIEMPHMNGFELLEAVAPFQFQVVFTTSHDQYAIRAIRLSALDYLLKPVDPQELRAAIDKVVARSPAQWTGQLELLLKRIQQPQQLVNRIALPTSNGLQMIAIDTIVYCIASSNYTTFILKGSQKLIVSRTLKEIEEMLDEYSFLRVHHSCLVNLQEIQKYNRGEGGTLLMSDGSLVDVSRSRKEHVLQKLTRR